MSEPTHQPFAEQRAVATDLLVLVGPADAAALTGAVGAALEAHEQLLQAAERRPEQEWLRHRAIGAGRVLEAMSRSLWAALS
ncbi:MAG TPA: hypothetical protein VGJ59_21455 [Jatrophihabitantaceae bacterium]